ncbi:arginase [Salibacterium aidingense]|uniref:arginase n=1 Tax=Salibacterium aidingense TaxID=384933 RepID=UPI0003F4F630|nr:arginase [Salibacterium aidingense]
MNGRKTISVIGVPMDLGQVRRGVDMGPSALRYADLHEQLEELGYDVNDKGDLRVERPEAQKEGLKNLHEIVQVSTELMEHFTEVSQRGEFPLVLGGDHSVSIGSVAAAGIQDETLGLIWYDAHPDLNTEETSPSGNIHGMPLAVSLGLGHPQLTGVGKAVPKIKPENIVIIGARSIDEGEKELIQHHGIKIYTMHDIDRLGMTRVMEESVQYFDHKTSNVHLSFDLDALDPQDAPGVGTPVLGGISYRESHLAFEMLSEADIVTSADVVEVNPILDQRNQTAIMAVELLTSLFGKRLLD